MIREGINPDTTTLEISDSRREELSRTNLYGSLGDDPLMHVVRHSLDVRRQEEGDDKGHQWKCNFPESARRYEP